MARPRSATRPLTRWPLALIVLLGLAGAAIGGLMTWHHENQLYGGGDVHGALIGCVETAEVNCDVVNTSEFSEFLGVPIATWAIPTYLTIALLALWGLRGERSALGLLVLAGVAAVGYSGFLYWVSKTQLQYVCAWCIRLYFINGGIFVLALVAGGLAVPRPNARTWGIAAGAFAVLALVSVLGERGYRSMLLAEAPTITALGAGGAGEAEGLDPEGKAPERSFEVRTEEGKTAILRVSPDDPWKGNPGAAVTIIEFADFECGYCKRMSAELERLYEAYKDRVLFVFKHFPLNPQCNPGVRNLRHRDACRAAEASVCAREQRRFWAFHDLAFKNQHQLSPGDLRVYAQKAGVDLRAYDRCKARGKAADVVRADGAEGAALDIHGTPRVWINGRLYRAGTSAEQLARIVESALGANAADAERAAKAIHDSHEAIAPVPADAPEMRAILYGPLAFKIDTFEASVVDGKAVSAKGTAPATRANWFRARDACAAAGKRLCGEAEWIAACQGAEPVDDDRDGAFADDMIEGTAYPYGDFHLRGRCWDGRPETERPVYTGEMPGCVSKDGVYDLTGNVE
ncbi:MAG: thioredoxin domain-containing protein, partial [Myxococcales bacterium]|nr:thioredoxin domain-containing protein [Myxococcales bacterium]